MPTDPERAVPGSDRPEADQQGGESACLLHRVCPHCDAVADDEPPTICPRCHRSFPV